MESKYEIQQTTQALDAVTDTKQKCGFTPNTPNATKDELFWLIKAALSERLNTPDTNFRYRVLPDGKWIHLHGPLILPGCEWIDAAELAADRREREIAEGYEGRR